MRLRSDLEFPEFSARELEVMSLAMEGHTDSSIANKLEISEATVSTYWGRIRIKLGPFSRTELVAIYLQHQNAKTLEDLRQANEQLTQQAAGHDERLWRKILDGAPDAIFVVREDGTIEAANEQAEKLFGYKIGELAGRSISELIPDRYRKAHDAHRTTYLANPEKRKMGEHLQTLALRKDGSEFFVAAALNATKIGEATLITCIVREVEHPKLLDDV